MLQSGRQAASNPLRRVMDLQTTAIKALADAISDGHLTEPEFPSVQAALYDVIAAQHEAAAIEQTPAPTLAGGWGWH